MFGWTTVFCGKNFVTYDIMCILFTKFFHTCRAYRRHWFSNSLYHFVTWSWLRVKGHQKAIPVGFILWHTFRMKSDVVLKQFKLNNLIQPQQSDTILQMSHISQSVLIEFGMLLSQVSIMNLILIFLIQSICKGENITSEIWGKKEKQKEEEISVSLLSDI